MSLSSGEYFLLRVRKAWRPACLEEVTQNTNYLALGYAILVPKGNLKTCLLTYQDKPLTTKTGRDLESVSVAFQPSVYGGTGEETRKGIVFRITKAVSYTHLTLPTIYSV